MGINPILSFNNLSIKEINRHKLFATIYQHPHLPKQQLSQLLEMSLSTTDNNLKVLLNNKLIKPSCTLESTGGRKATGYMVNARYKMAVGVFVTATQALVTVVDLNGNSIADTSLPLIYAPSQELSSTTAPSSAALKVLDAHATIAGAAGATATITTAAATDTAAAGSGAAGAAAGLATAGSAYHSASSDKSGPDGTSFDKSGPDGTSFDNSGPADPSFDSSSYKAACDAYFASLNEQIMNWLHELQFNADDILGIALAVPGVVDPQQGKVIYGALMHHVALEITDIQAHFSLPCVLHHDSKAAAFAELWENRDMDNAALFLLNEHFGGALIFNHMVHYGNHSHGGLIEHLQVGKERRACYCGDYDCLECYCSKQALEQEAKLPLPEFFNALRQHQQRQCPQQQSTEPSTAATPSTVTEPSPVAAPSTAAGQISATAPSLTLISPNKNKSKSKSSNQSRSENKKNIASAAVAAVSTTAETASGCVDSTSSRADQARSCADKTIPRADKASSSTETPNAALLLPLLWQQWLSKLAQAIRSVNQVMDGRIILTGSIAPYLNQDDITTLLQYCNEHNAFPLTREQLMVSTRSDIVVALGAARYLINAYLGAFDANPLNDRHYNLAHLKLNLGSAAP